MEKTITVDVCCHWTCSNWTSVDTRQRPTRGITFSMYLQMVLSTFTGRVDRLQLTIIIQLIFNIQTMVLIGGSATASLRYNRYKNHRSKPGGSLKHIGSTLSNIISRLRFSHSARLLLIARLTSFQKVDIISIQVPYLNRQTAAIAYSGMNHGQAWQSAQMNHDHQRPLPPVRRGNTISGATIESLDWPEHNPSHGICSSDEAFIEAKTNAKPAWLYVPQKSPTIVKRIFKRCSVLS